MMQEINPQETTRAYAFRDVDESAHAYGDAFLVKNSTRDEAPPHKLASMV